MYIHVRIFNGSVTIIYQVSDKKTGVYKMNMNPHNIKLVAVDMDGTFARSDYTYDIHRFNAIFSRMKEVGCAFVVASGN